MTISLAGTIQAKINMVLTDTTASILDTRTGALALTGPTTSAIADGTGANQAQDLFTQTAALADAGAVSLDFSGGALTNPFGTTISWSALKLLFIENTSVESSLEVTGNLWDDISGGTTETLTIAPRSFYWQTMMDAGGQAIVAGTGDTITLTHASDGSLSLTYKVVALGETA